MSSRSAHNRVSRSQNLIENAYQDKPLPTGLTDEEVRIRLEGFGFNIIQEEARRPIWLLLADQFKSPLVILLIFACVLSLFMGEWVEAIAIALILFLNALIGFIQEYRAETAIKALKSMTQPRAKVIRAGKQAVIEAKTLVPGDILVLEAGDIVGADAVILEASRLQMNEAILTGESIPVEKIKGGSIQGSIVDRAGAVFMGTSVVTGTATTRVIATGMATELGKIAHLMTTAQIEPTPLQVQMEKIGKMLLLLCLVVVACVILFGIIQKRPGVELIIFAISLAVAAVPEGLPAIVTVALALGVQRMANRNALIRSLPSVETLGSVSVICTDKTGTLTTGKMRVRELWSDDHQNLIETAAACCDAELDSTGVSGTGDPTELAILIEAKTRGILKEDIERRNPRVLTEPFDSIRKRMSIVRKNGLIYVKGATEVLLSLVSEPREKLEGCKRALEGMASRGLRVLAVASGAERAEKGLKLIGLIGIADPPRTEVMDAILEAREAGITPIMITGDHPQTAAAIARELGLVIEEENLEGRVHARATPEDKLNLVRQWKSRGAIVAMTGDGVNDAPALKEAHIGIAMGKAGTEVTRQSADLVLADDNFATIVAAVREGRGIYQNIRKAVVYLLTGNFAELAVVFGASVLALPLPFTAAHLLWINLVTDSLPGLALIADPVPTNIMKNPPRSPKEQILGRAQWLQIAWVGSLEAMVILGLYFLELKSAGQDRARSIVFTAFVFSQLWRAFGARSQTKTFWQIGAWNNLWLLGVIVLSAVLQMSLHSISLTQRVFGLVPLALTDVQVILPASLIALSAIELQKLIRKSNVSISK